jgi:hypothetical protein
VWPKSWPNRTICETLRQQLDGGESRPAALAKRRGTRQVWLQRPILALDDEKPIELIARGELIAEIEYPGIS